MATLVAICRELPIVIRVPERVSGKPRQDKDNRLSSRVCICLHFLPAATYRPFVLALGGQEQLEVLYVFWNPQGGCCDSRPLHDYCLPRTCPGAGEDKPECPRARPSPR